MLKAIRIIIIALAILLSIFVASEGSDSSAPRGTIYGHVYDTETGVGIYGAFVLCEGKKDATDDEGYYAIEGGFAPSTSYTSTCYVSGYPDSSKTVTTDRDGKAEADFYLGSGQPNQPAKKIITTDIIEDHPFGDIGTTILEGAWILNLDDVQISMVIYQSEDLLFGAANSETPKLWNAAVSGSSSGDEVELTILSLQDDILVSTLIMGITAQDTITGSFVQSDSKGNVKEGSVMGFLTYPETSGYEPAG